MSIWKVGKGFDVSGDAGRIHKVKIGPVFIACANPPFDKVILWNAKLFAKGMERRCFVVKTFLNQTLLWIDGCNLQDFSSCRRQFYIAIVSRQCNRIFEHNLLVRYKEIDCIQPFAVVKVLIQPCPVVVVVQMSRRVCFIPQVRPK